MFCIMNIQKRKKNDIGGICAEANRNEDDKPVYDDDGNRISGKEFRNSKIDWERTRDNLFLRKSKNLQADVQNEIEQFAPDALVRKDSVMMCDVIFSASPEFFDACYCDGVNLFFEKADDYFNDCMKFAEREFGHVVNAVVHYDETTPHMHLQFVPITKDGRLSAKEVLGNRKQYSERQDRFFENVGKKWGLDRGIRKSTESTRQHLTVAEYKAQTLENAVNKFFERTEKDIDTVYNPKITYQDFKKVLENFHAAVTDLKKETAAVKPMPITGAEEKVAKFKRLAKLKQSRGKAR